MRSIRIYFRDGSNQTFTEKGRAGGSYTIRAEYLLGFVKVIDEYGRVEAFPADTIIRVEEEPEPRGW